MHVLHASLELTRKHTQQLQGRNEGERPPQTLRLCGLHMQIGEQPNRVSELI